MPQYLQFTAPDGTQILVETDDSGGSVVEGDREVGIMDRLGSIIHKADSTLSDSMRGIIRSNVEAFLDTILGLERRPKTVEVSFGLKATGELGNLAVGKMGGEVNYTVKLVWEPDSSPTQ